MNSEDFAQPFVIQSLIPKGHVTLLGGHGGSGKSMLALIWAAHVACGVDWAGQVIKKGNVIFVSLEDAGLVVLPRLRRIVEAYNLDPGAVSSGLRVLDGTKAETALVTERNEFGQRRLLTTDTLREVSSAAKGAGLVIVDNASEAFDGDENGRRQVRSFIRHLSEIAAANTSGMLLLAHIDKHAARNGSGGNSYSGSTAWHNSVRSRLALVPGPDGVELRQEKLNLGRAARAVSLKWSPGGVLVPAQYLDDEELREQIAEHDADHVLAAIRAALNSGQRVPAAINGPDTVTNALENLRELGADYRNKEGRQRVRAALLRLEKDRRIVREVQQSPARNKREFWKLAALTQALQEPSR